LPVVPDVPGVPSAEELAALPHAELAVRLAEAYRLIAELTARVDQLERRVRRDSSTSSRPPSSDSPYKKEEPRDRSLRERGKRRPGKQPGELGTTMRLVDDPDERLECPPAECRGCGAGLAGEEVTAQRRHQVTGIEPAPAPKVTEYVAQAKECPCCGTVTEGELPAHVRARASYGPEASAQAANLVAGHYIPVYRATLLLCQLAGLRVSTGWMAGIRGRPPAWSGAAGSWSGSGSCCGLRRRCTRTRPRPALRAGWRMCTWPAPPISRTCTPGTGPRSRSTPAACCPAIAGSSSATVITATRT
jgi:hypothetical protein